ncbi:MAG: hypothetical protein SPE59_02395 [Treponema sp.]|nr:hypothetical protein [Spirochaetia bacterium]MDY5122628.1 hypothetical protein [Treponema sp.]
MKKLLAVAVMAVTMISSTFALNLSVGVKGLAGANVGTNIVENAQKISSDTAFIYGAGAYIDFSIFGPAGFQIGANFSNNEVTTDDGSFTNYLLDVPVMLWADFKIGPVGIGAGGGLNLSFVVDSISKDSVVSSVTSNVFNYGITAGANAKFYPKKFFAIVVGATYVLDISPTKITPASVVSGEPLLTFNRGILSGNLGVEFKLF